MREDGVDEFLKRSNGTWEIIDNLVKEDKLAEAEYNGKKFYIRKFPVQCKNIKTFTN